MVPNGVSEGKLCEAGFMYNQEKGSWYHQGTEFGRRKAEPEDRSVEKMVNYLEVGHLVLSPPPSLDSFCLFRNFVEGAARRV